MTPVPGLRVKAGGGPGPLGTRFWEARAGTPRGGGGGCAWRRDSGRLTKPSPGARRRRVGGGSIRGFAGGGGDGSREGGRRIGGGREEGEGGDSRSVPRRRSFPCRRHREVRPERRWPVSVPRWSPQRRARQVRNPLGAPPPPPAAAAAAASSAARPRAAEVGLGEGSEEGGGGEGSGPTGAGPASLALLPAAAAPTAAAATAAAPPPRSRAGARTRASGLLGSRAVCGSRARSSPLPGKAISPAPSAGAVAPAGASRTA
jgi:hypothetical protein